VATLRKKNNRLFHLSIPQCQRYTSKQRDEGIRSDCLTNTTIVLNHGLIQLVSSTDIDPRTVSTINHNIATG
jgi:hypothetical protein